MTLTRKQTAALAKAAPAQKASMKAAFERQNAGVVQRVFPQRTLAARRGIGSNLQLPLARRGATTQTSGLYQTKTRVPKPAHVKNFLDPQCPIDAPGLVSDGRALAHTSLVSDDFVVGTTNTTILLVTNTGCAGTVGYLCNVDSNTGIYVDGSKLLTIPTLATGDISGGPSSGRAMKFSASVVNCSNALKRGGRVTYINSSQRLAGITDDPSAFNYTPLIEGIKSSPYRRRVNGASLAEPTKLIGYPVDSMAYNSFMGWNGTLTWDEFFSFIMAANYACPDPARRPMSTVAFIFDPVADAQEYTITIRASFYTRWPLTSVPGQNMRAMPTSTSHHINAVRDHNEDTANDLKHVAEGGALGVAGVGLAKSAQGLLARGATAAADAALPLLEGAAMAVL